MLDMRTPFPGMDPWLERPDLWLDVHNSLISAIRLDLAPRLRPRYYVRIEERTYVSEAEELVVVARPDLSVHDRGGGASSGPEQAGTRAGAVAVQVPLPDRVRETYLEIHVAETGDLVTAIELLSPTNKRPGEGREVYLEKRQAVLGSRTNLVEIDLVRAGDPMPILGVAAASAYRILVSRGDRRPHAELFPFGVRDAVPRFDVPLRTDDEDEPELDVGALLADLYERVGYDLMVDYASEPLAAADREWADGVLRAAGLRA